MRIGFVIRLWLIQKAAKCIPIVIGVEFQYLLLWYDSSDVVVTLPVALTKSISIAGDMRL